VPFFPGHILGETTNLTRKVKRDILDVRQSGIGELPLDITALYRAFFLGHELRIPVKIPSVMLVFIVSVPYFDLDNLVRSIQLYPTEVSACVVSLPQINFSSTSS
jgi:hypothetical protein